MINACAVILFSLISFFPHSFLSTHALEIELFLFMFLFILLLDKELRRNLFSKHDWWLWLFLASMFAGTINATQKQVVLKVYFHLFIIFALLFYIGKGIFRREKETNFLTVLIPCLSCAVAIIGFLELFNARNILYERFFLSPYYERYVKFGHRILSTQYNPVVLGSYLIFCLPFSLILSENKSPALKRLGIFSSLVCIIAALLTFSRGVFLGAVILLLFYFWQTGKKKSLALAIVCVTALVLSASLHKKEPLGRFGFGRLFIGSYDSVLSEYRLSRIKMTARIFKDHPFTGIGFEHFRIRFTEFCELGDKKIPYEFMIPDNMYLTFLAETGICGVSGFLVFIVFILRKSFYRLRNNFYLGETRQITIGLISALLGLLVNMGGYELFYWDNPLMLLALLCGFLAAGSRSYQGYQEV